MTSESSRQKFAKDIIVIAVTNFLVALRRLALLPIITKTLGAHDYGIWAQINVTLGLLMSFAQLGLTQAMVRFLAGEKNREQIQDGFHSVLSLVFLATLVVSLLFIIFADFIATAFFGGATPIVRLTGVIILLHSLSWVYFSLLRTLLQMRMHSFLTVVGVYGELGIIIYLVLSGHGLLSVVVSVLIVKAILLFILFFLIKSRIGIKRPHFLRTREYLNFGLPTIPRGMAAWALSSSDRYVIAYFLGVTSVGIYSAGYGLGSIPIVAGSVLGFVLTPTVSKLYDEGRMSEVKTHLSYSLKYSLALAIPFVFGAALLGKQMLRVFSTPEIASQGYLIVPLIALGTLFVCTHGVLEQILVLVKKTRIMGVAWLVAAPVNLLLNILIVPYMGILGAAITTAFAYLLALGITTYYSLKEFRFNIEWSFVFKSLIASVIMSLLVWWFDPVTTFEVIIVVAGGIIVYTTSLVLMKGFKKEEIRFLRRLFQRTKGRTT